MLQTPAQCTRQAGHPSSFKRSQRSTSEHAKPTGASNRTPAFVTQVQELTLGGRMKSALIMRPNISCMRRTPFTCSRTSSSSVWFDVACHSARFRGWSVSSSCNMHAAHPLILRPPEREAAHQHDIQHDATGPDVRALAVIDLCCQHLQADDNLFALAVDRSWGQCTKTCPQGLRLSATLRSYLSPS